MSRSSVGPSRSRRFGFEGPNAGEKMTKWEEQRGGRQVVGGGFGRPDLLERPSGPASDRGERGGALPEAKSAANGELFRHGS